MLRINQNNYIKILMLLLVLILFRFDDINAATITNFTEFSATTGNKKCTVDYCAASIDAGFQASVINNNGNRIGKIVNFWTNNNTKKYITGEVKSIETQYNTGDYTCNNNKGLISNLDDNVNIYDASLNLPTGKGSEFFYSDYFRSINTQKIKTILNYLDTGIEDFSNYYLKIEPIYIIRERYGDRCNYIAGTSRYILSNWKKDNMDQKTLGNYYKNGGCSNSIPGHWNVIRNYIVSMYYDCSNSGLGPNTACYNSSVHGSLSGYKSESGCSGTDSKPDTNVPTLNSLYQNGNGLGVGYLKISDYLKSKLKIVKRKSGTQSNIYSDTAEFNVYKEHGCLTKNFLGTYTTQSSFVEIQLAEGKYSIEEKKPPYGYDIEKDEEGNIKCYDTEVEANQITTEYINNKITCEYELELALEEIQGALIGILAGDIKTYYTKRAEKLFELYKKYPNLNGLLNVKEPSCSVINCSKSTTISGCLTANESNSSTNSNFNRLNLACYDSSIQDDEGTYLGFCKSSMELKNNFKLLNNSIFSTPSTMTFYGKSGSLLIQEYKADNSLISLGSESVGLKTYDYDKKMNMYSLNKYIASSEVKNECYVYDKYYGSSLSRDNNNNYIDDLIESKIDDLSSLNVYFGDNDNNGIADTLKYDTVSSAFSPETYSLTAEDTANFLWRISSAVLKGYEAVINSIDFISPFSKIVYTGRRNYKLNTVYIEDMTGELSTNETTFLNYKTTTGIISKFNDKTGSIPFSVKYKNKNYDSDSCKYVVEQEFVKNNKLQLEFRSIDTKNPFTRETNSNWCDFSGNCDATNLNTLLYIKLRTNSYGMNPCGQKQTPLYEITLSPSDIKKIRDYNESNAYDNYSKPLYCDQEGNCMNSFLHQLTIKKLDGSVNLTNGLTINENNHIVCDVKQKLQDELNKLDSAVRNKIETELEELGDVFNLNN